MKRCRKCYGDGDFEYADVAKWVGIVLFCMSILPTGFVYLWALHLFFMFMGVPHGPAWCIAIFGHIPVAIAIGVVHDMRHQQ